MKNIMLSVPMLANVHPRVFATFGAAMYRWGVENGDAGFRLATPLRVPIESGRNACAAVVREDPSIDFLFFLDEDTEMHPDTIKRLVRRMDENEDLIAIMPRYYVRGYPYELMAYRFNEEGHLESPSPEQEEEWTDENQLLWCNAIGNSCSLIRGDAFRLIPGPRYFKTGDHHTEDIYFYLKVREYLPKAKIAMDMSFTCGHLLGTGSVSSANVKELRSRFERFAEEGNEEHIFSMDPSLGRV